MKMHIAILLSICLAVMALALTTGCNETETATPSDSTPSGGETNTGETPKPELTLDDAADIFNLVSELPSGFRFSGGGEAGTMEPLGVGSPSYFLIEGTVINPNTNLPGDDFYEIQCILWIVDEATANMVNVSDLLEGGQGNTQIVDLGSSVDAALDTLEGEGAVRGIEVLWLKYGNVYVGMFSGYTLPRSEEECALLIHLGRIVVERLGEYSLPDASN